MQQQLQEREVSFSLLAKAQVLYNTWNKIQSKSITYFQSIDNIIAQRHASLELTSLLEQYNVDQLELIYKQTNAIEKLFKQLHATLELFEKVCTDWSQLETEAKRHLTKSLSVPSVGHLPLSTQSLIQVTAVKPTQVHDMISQLARMYYEEYTYKSIAFSTMPQQLDQFQNVSDRWIAETHIDNALMITISERIQLYKQVKKILESVD